MNEVGYAHIIIPAIKEQCQCNFILFSLPVIPLKYLNPNLFITVKRYCCLYEIKHSIVSRILLKQVKEHIATSFK